MSDGIDFGMSVALMHEANPSRRLGGPGARDFRRYTLYARPL